MYQYEDSRLCALTYYKLYWALVGLEALMKFEILMWFMNLEADESSTDAQDISDLQTMAVCMEAKPQSWDSPLIIESRNAV